MNNLMKKIYKNRLLLSGICIIFYFLLFYFITSNFEIRDVKRFQNISILGIILITIIFSIKKYDSKKIIISIVLIGLILRTAYVLYTPINVRQHDIEGEFGNLSYIHTIYETGELPDSNSWQFYQQPLHHIISAIWLKANTALGIDMQKSIEGIQFLTAIYSSLIMIITYAILKEMNIKNKFIIMIMLIIAVHPTFIILSGSINNDILMVMFIFLDLLYLLKWNKNSNIKNTILLAIFTALTALSKISGTIIAVPIIYVFLRKFIEDYKSENNHSKIIKSYIGKFSLFGVIALGLGLSYSIRNMILFGQSIFYVPEPPSTLYFGDRDIFEILKAFLYEIRETFADAFKDINPFAFIIKSSLFGEYSTNKISILIPMLMIFLNIFLIIISLVDMVKSLNNKKMNKTEKKTLKIFVIFYLAEMFMYFFSVITKPYGCTMDFRYIVPTIFTGMIFIAYGLMNYEREDKKESNKIYPIIMSIIVLFAILSIVFEINYLNIVK